MLDIIFGRKDKKDTIDNEIKTDKPIVKTEINRQDILDAMLGRNGKITVEHVAIDTMTMCEIPMRDKLIGLTTMRGIVTSSQCFNKGTDSYGHSKVLVLMNSIKNASYLEIIIGEEIFEVCRDNSLPEVSIGDDIEVMYKYSHTRAKSGFTPHSGDRNVQQILVLKNHTSGTIWHFSMRKAAIGF